MISKIWFIFPLFFALSVVAEELPDEITPESQEAIRRGLKFLAEQQDEQVGFWRSDVGYKLNVSYQVTANHKPHVGVSAMACMAFMANGNLPNRGPYGKHLQKGIHFILSCAHEQTGYISRHGTRMYSHAFATLCLAEVYGMTGRKDIRRVLEKATNLIVECQNAQGGWRYEPIAMDADISITVCQVQALRAARNVGIKVPKKNIDDAIEYVRKSSIYNGAFKYQLLPMHESRVSFALTAAGVTALHGAGVYEDELIKKGLNYLLNPPGGDPHPSSNHYFYYYGHYYAIQAMYLAGNPYWQAWFPRIRNELIRIQNRGDGSWEDNVGKIYATAVATLILQVPYQYLPIFQR
jgi:hypothetical protein